MGGVFISLLGCCCSETAENLVRMRRRIRIAGRHDSTKLNFQGKAKAHFVPFCVNGFGIILRSWSA